METHQVTVILHTTSEQVGTIWWNWLDEQQCNKSLNCGLYVFVDVESKDGWFNIAALITFIMGKLWEICSSARYIISVTTQRHVVMSHNHSWSIYQTNRDLQVIWSTFLYLFPKYQTNNSSSRVRTFQRWDKLTSTINLLIFDWRVLICWLKNWAWRVFESSATQETSCLCAVFGVCLLTFIQKLETTS